MEVLGVGPLEALFIMLIALIVVGPRDIGKVARSAGRLLNRLYRSEAWRNISEASRNLRTLPNRLAREAALEELDQVRKDLREEVTRDLRADLGLTPPPSTTETQPSATSDSPADQDPPRPAPSSAGHSGDPDREPPATGAPERQSQD